MLLVINLMSAGKIKYRTATQTGSSARQGHYFLPGCFVGAGIIIFITVYCCQDKLLEILKKKL